MSGWPPGGEAYEVEPVAGRMPGSVVLPPSPGDLVRRIAVLEEEKRTAMLIIAYLVAEAGGLVIIPDTALTGDHSRLKITRADDMYSVVLGAGTDREGGK